MDGILFTGGPDIESVPLEGKAPPQDGPDARGPRACDFLTIREVLKRDLPTLCICCGHQELNVALGGSLHQHVYDLPGVKSHSEGVTHPVALTGVSMTRDIVEVPAYGQFVAPPGDQRPGPRPRGHRRKLLA